MSQSDTGHPQRNALPAPKRSARRSRRSRRSRRAGAAMKSLLITASLLLLISGTRTQGGFDLSDALDDHPTDAPKPKEPTKSPEKPKPDSPKTTKKPSIPSGGGGGGGDGFDLGDALLPDPKTTKKPSVPSGGGGGGGGGSFSDDDLLNTLDDGYKPDKTGSRGRAADSNYDAAGGADQPQDPDLLLAQLLKTLSALLPQELLEWVSNVKRALGPLVERGLDLLQNLV
ncbi:CD99 antigen isoform X3 [Oryzias latipes]|uniref:CD99 antigen isoform X3 n=1 Tax=Oryzias latipes TaxID=8090 RepID=UPI0005CBD754|nr:CD99 antigen isoform X3 [Oryzias latipes]